jgi:hypothetical protein
MAGRALVCAVAVCFAAEAAVAAGVGQWRNYTSMKNATDVAATASEVVVSTSGGLFRWNPSENTFRQFTSAEGLQSIDLTAVGIDRDANVWTGTSGGLLHVLTPENSVIIIRDIATAQQTNKRINELVMTGDTVLICTDFGLSVFRTTRFEFGDTYTRFGTISPNVRVAALSTAVFGGAVRRPDHSYARQRKPEPSQPVTSRVLEPAASRPTGVCTALAGGLQQHALLRHVRGALPVRRRIVDGRRAARCRAHD